MARFWTLIFQCLFLGCTLVSLHVHQINLDFIARLRTSLDLVGFLKDLSSYNEDVTCFF